MAGNAPVRASDFLREFALGNYREFRSDPLSRRKAYNAAVSIWHTFDHVVKRDQMGRSGSVKNYTQRLTQQYAELRWVEAFCNAYKHVSDHVRVDGAKDFNHSVLLVHVPPRKIQAPIEPITSSVSVNGMTSTSISFNSETQILVMRTASGICRSVEHVLWDGIRIAADIAECSGELQPSDCPTIAEIPSGA